MLDIKSAYKDAKRLKQIASVMLKTGLGYYLEDLKLNQHLFWHQRAATKEKPSDLKVKLRLAMDELGGSFVKLGQLLSLRPDLIPDEYCEEFSKLQDGVTPFSYNEAKEIIEKELKHKLTDIFSYFEREPIASASIGQVHKAGLLNGEKVVVKVQRVRIGEVMKEDIDLLYYLAELLQTRFEKLKEYNLKGIVDEFKRYTLDELDYLKEARNIDRFYDNFKDSDKIKIPKVYRDYTTKKVLVMSYINGIPIDDREEFKEWGCDNKIIAKNLADCFLKQVFEYGFFHADPHPANVFVMHGNKIALLDYGICGQLTGEMKEELVVMLLALVNRNVKGAVEGFLDMGVLEEGNEELVRELELIVEEYADSNVEEIDAVHLFKELIFIAEGHRFKLPVDFILLVKAIVTCEGVGRSLDPKFNLSNALHDYVDGLTRRKLKPSHLVKAFIGDVEEIRANVKSIPSQINQILTKLKRGELGVQFERKDLIQLEREMDKSSSRISLGMIIAALIVASAIILQVRNGKWLAVAGFAIAIFLTIHLSLSVIRERRILV